MSGTRFRYALEPVRLTREWDLLDCQARLAAHNVSLKACQEHLASLRASAESAMAEWNALGAADGSFTVGQMSVHGAWLGDLARQIEEQVDEEKRLLAEQDELLAAANTAQRLLDGMEEHRDEARKEFRAGCAADEFKEADERWSSRSAKEQTDGT